MTIEENKESVFASVAQAAEAAGRPANSVSIVAVTKYVDSEVAQELVDTGVRHIGENRVDKFLEKYDQVSGPDLTWHLIGTLQRRKVKDVINYVDYFHALDSVKLAQEINKRADHVIKCFLQVNLSGEETKHGFREDEIDSALSEMANLDQVELVGLMTMAPFEATEEDLNHLFKEMKLLQERLQERQIPNMPFTELSMGMSRDYPVAIANGATYVRIGTSFFK